MIVPRSRSFLHRALVREIPRMRQKMRTMAWNRTIPMTPTAIQMDSLSGCVVLLVGLGIASIVARLAAVVG
jgi:phosphoglycerate dehydrogenase-like enzyme